MVKRTHKAKRKRGGALRMRGVNMMHGEGFFGDLWDGIKSVGRWVKDNKIISRVASVIPHPAAKVVSGVAGAVGLGKRKRKGKMRGGAIIL